MNKEPYVSHHNHTHYSLLDGFSTPKEYLQRCKDLGMKSFTITEHGNQFSWVYFAKEQENFPDIKINYGVELYECFDMNVKDTNNRYFHLIAIARNEKGRIALNEIITKSNTEGFYYKPRVDINLLKKYGDDIIVSTACLASKIAREKDYDKCIKYIKEYKEIFPNFFLEMQSHKNTEQEQYNKKILQLSKDTDTDFIITTDSHVTKQEDLEYQGYHIQIARDKETMSEIYEGCYMQDSNDIHNIMDKQIGKENVTLGLANTIKVDNLIEQIELPFQKPQFPDFDIPKQFNNACEYLKNLVEIGWKDKLNNIKQEDYDTYKERLDYELSVIDDMGFNEYFLVIWDAIKYAKDNNIIVGVGRGSALGSLVCYLLDITGVDPIKYGLIFERFLNPERVSFPDIDVDFAERKKIIDYFIEKYSSPKVCQIINFSYITPIVAVKDIARILDIPYKISDDISKRFVYDTIEQSLEYDETLRQDCNNIHEKWMDIAIKICGRVRQASTHAGGVGIVKDKITNYMAMTVGKDGEHVIQVDKRYIEELGIIKYDILGLTTLKVIQSCKNECGLTSWNLDINNEKFLNDKKTFELLRNANTDQVFQVESSGMKNLLQTLQVSNLEELTALIALFRPDSMNYIHDFIENKKDTKRISYIHPDMAEILDVTYGCMIYQEQLMKIVRKFGGRTYGGADKFRKAVGKKDKKLIKKESTKLYQEIIDNGYTEKIARYISDDLKEKGSYMFNLSHATGYAVIALQTAYLKAHYPLSFFKNVLNKWVNKPEKLSKYIYDAKQNNVRVKAPHINHSNKQFTIVDNSILFGLEAISGLGEKLVQPLIEERNKNGIFKGLDNLIKRTNLSISKLICLLKAGAIPTKNKQETLKEIAEYFYQPTIYKDIVTVPTKKDLKEKWNINPNLDKKEKLKILNQRRFNLYQLKEKERKQKFIKPYLDEIQSYDIWEFESIGVFLNYNPFEKYYKHMQNIHKVKEGETFVLVGIISDIDKKVDKNKNKYADVSVASSNGIHEVRFWASHYSKYLTLIKKKKRIALYCQKNDNLLTVIEAKDFYLWEKTTNVKF